MAKISIITGTEIYEKSTHEINYKFMFESNAPDDHCVGYPYYGYYDGEVLCLGEGSKMVMSAPDWAIKEGDLYDGVVLMKKDLLAHFKSLLPPGTEIVEWHHDGPLHTA